MEIFVESFVLYNLTSNVTVKTETLKDDNENEMWHNVIEDFKQSQFTLTEPTTIVLLALYVPIFLTSLVGNVLVLLVIVPNQRMWTVTNNFLVNLAVADLLVTILCMPMTLVGKIYKLWVYGNFLCKTTPYLQGVSVTASTFTITAMSLDRCLAILYPVKLRNIRTKRNVRILIAMIWATALLVIIPLLVVNRTVSQDIYTNIQMVTCTEAWQSVTHRRAYDFSLLFIVCLIPAQIVTVAYLLMGKRLWVTDASLTSHNQCKRVHSGGDSRKCAIDSVRASRRRTAKMCIIVSIVFVICWLPFYVVNIYLDFKGDQDAVGTVYWALLVGHLHCITNPILYCFMHKTFRYCVKQMLPCSKELLRSPSRYSASTFDRHRAGSYMTSIRSHKRRKLSKQSRLLSTPSTSPSISKRKDNAGNANQAADKLGSHDTASMPCGKINFIFNKRQKTKSNKFMLINIPSSILEEEKSTTTLESL